MALIQYAAPWDRQPQEAVEIDWSDPTNSGSVFLWSAANPNVEAITGRLVTTNNTTGVVDQYGRSVRSSTGQTNLEWNSEFFKTSDGAGTGDFSALIVANPAASGSGAVQHIFSHKNDAGGSPFGQFVFAAHMNPSSGAYASGNATFFTYASTSVGVASAGATDGEMHVWGIRRSGNDHYLFKDGVQLATTNNFARDVVQTTTRYTAIGSRGNGTTEGYDRDVAFVQGWDRALTDTEILERSRSILSVYRAFAPQTIWVPVSAGGGSPDVTVAATGVAATGSSGTASPATDKAISGQSATASSGTASPSLANALTGNAATSAGGLVSPSVTIALTGVSATTSVGTVSPSSGVTVALTGVEATTSAGSVGPGAVVAPSGQQATASVGAVSVASLDVTVALSGVSASASVGSVSASGGASVGGGMGFEMGGSKKRRIVKIRWNGYDYTLDRDALPAFLESIEEQAEEKVTKKRNAKKKPAPLARIVSAPADVMPDLQERIAAVNRSIGALWGAKDDEEEEEILWLMV